MSEFERVSVHGGHSGSFCSHALDPLDAVVDRYVAMGFSWICLTEHMPTENADLMSADESREGFDIPLLQERFTAYFAEARALAEQYRDRIDIMVGFETEAYTGYQDEIAGLIRSLQPDMIVGSVHHVHDVLFDGGVDEYARAVELSGGIEALYCDYFDLQLDLIERFEPAVVGHFDLIRIHDPDYRSRWQVPEIRERALRNLDRIRDLDLILDLNVRALTKGAPETYVSSPWLDHAIRAGIAVAPGDDSHGVDSVGLNLDAGIRAYLDRGGSAAWPRPSRHRHRA